MSEVAAGGRSRFRVEAPTAALAVIIYGGWIAATLAWRLVPWPLLVVAGALVWQAPQPAQYHALGAAPTRAAF